MMKKIILLLLLLFFVLMSACEEDEIVPPTLNSPEHDEALFGFWGTEAAVMEISSEGSLIRMGELYSWETDSVFLILTQSDPDTEIVIEYEVDHYDLFLGPRTDTFREAFERPLYNDTLVIGNEPVNIDITFPFMLNLTIDITKPCENIQRIAEGEYPAGQNRIVWEPLNTIESGEYAVKCNIIDSTSAFDLAAYYFYTVIRE